MPHFLKPPASPPAGYDADNKLAPGSLWRVLIPLVGTRTVALRGGAGLKVTSNNPNVVPADGLRELAPIGDLRIFEIFGASEGGSWIDVWGLDGAFLIRLQALVQKAAGQAGGAAGGKRILDIIVRFQGSKFTAEMAERDVFPDAALARYKTSAVAANREVARAGYFTKEIGQGASGVVAGTMDTMRTKLKDKQLGKILIYGSSSGGRVAIDLAARLTTNNMPVHYLAVLDPAWYPDDTTTEANLTGDLNVPVFPAPSIVALEKDNYYQTHGNESKLSSHGRRFTSDMFGEEIHGRIVGFRSLDLTGQIPKLDAVLKDRGDQYHRTLIGQGTPLVEVRIATLLSQFRPIVYR